VLVLLDRFICLLIGCSCGGGEGRDMYVEFRVQRVGVLVVDGGR
jgi:hypothetical protein